MKKELEINQLVICPYIMGKLRIKQIYHEKALCEIISWYGRLIEIPKIDLEVICKA